MADYKNIPVDEETYERVRSIADSNGFGKRGMGAQVRQWSVQELAAAVCDHPKVPVQVQWMPDDVSLSGDQTLLHSGWYCPTCRRVYRNAAKPKIGTVAVETAEVNADDPYGQPAPRKTKKRGSRRDS